jgi:hypothetical protein
MDRFEHVVCSNCGHTVNDGNGNLQKHLDDLAKEIAPFMDVVRELGGIPEVTWKICPEGNYLKAHRAGTGEDTRGFRAWLSRRNVAGKRVWFRDYRRCTVWDGTSEQFIWLAIEGVDL